MKPTGYLIHEDAFRVVIATGFGGRRSANRKTGGMVQVWVLVKASDPIQAAASGGDVAICGGCPMRGRVVRGKRVSPRACYVNLGQAPLAVWRAYRRGAYPRLPSVEVFQGLKIRWGAYGDPAFIPAPLLAAVNQVAAGWTGYTHQWRRPWMSGYRQWLMASVDSNEERIQAQAMGWRTFQVVPRGGKPEGTRPGSLCPSERGVSCADCLRCSGTASATRSVWIPAHGIGAKYVS